jgi:hypothetical protein
MRSLAMCLALLAAAIAAATYTPAILAEPPQVDTAEIEDPFTNRYERQATTEVRQATPEIRNVRWFWSSDQVRRAETIALTEDAQTQRIKVLTGSDTVAGHEAKVQFDFFDDELLEITYVFAKRFTKDTYDQLSAALTDKYGRGMNMVARAEAKGQRLASGQKEALSELGQMMHYAAFSNATTEVILFVHGDDRINIACKSASPEAERKMQTRDEHAEGDKGRQLRDKF